MKYKGYIKLEYEVEAENEEQAKEKIADYWGDVLLVGFDRSDVELESSNKGKWIKTYPDHKKWNVYECSHCGEELDLTEGTLHDRGYNFCPYCGADMRPKFYKKGEYR